MNSSLYIATGTLVVLGLLFALMMRSADKKLSAIKARPRKR